MREHSTKTKLFAVVGSKTNVQKITAWDI